MPRVVASRYRKGIRQEVTQEKLIWILIASSLIPLGGHYVKHLMGPLKTFFTSDKGWAMSSTTFGTLLSASGWSLVMAPFCAGLAVDVFGAHISAVGFCALSLFSHVVFIVSCQNHVLIAALVTRCLYGIGEAGMSVAQGGIIGHTFNRDRITLAIGVSESVRAFANWLGQALPAQIAQATSSHYGALWFGACLLVLSLIFSMACFILAYDNQILDPKNPLTASRIQSRRVKPKNICELPMIFWVMVFLHVLFNNVHNLFGGISTDLIHSRWGKTVAVAGWLSSLDTLPPIVCCTLISVLVDRYGGRLYWCGFAALCSCIGFLGILTTQNYLVLWLLLLSVNTIFTPTLLRSAIPLLLHPDMYGMGFGMYACLTGLFGNINILAGYLRDVMGTYDADIVIFLTMSVLALILCIVAYYLDANSDVPGILNLSKTALRTQSADLTDYPPPRLSLLLEDSETPRSRSGSELSSHMSKTLLANVAILDEPSLVVAAKYQAGELLPHP